MKNKITYDGNEQETYDLFLDGKKVAELLVGEDGVIEIVEKVRTFISTKRHEFLIDSNLVIQNDNDKLGLIVDLYDGENWLDGLTLWFDDFVD